MRHAPSVFFSRRQSSGAGAKRIGCSPQLKRSAGGSSGSGVSGAGGSSSAGGSGVVGVSRSEHPEVETGGWGSDVSLLRVDVLDSPVWILTIRP